MSVSGLLLSVFAKLTDAKSAEEFVIFANFICYPLMSRSFVQMSMNARQEPIVVTPTLHARTLSALTTVPAGRVMKETDFRAQVLQDWSYRFLFWLCGSFCSILKRLFRMAEACTSVKQPSRVHFHTLRTGKPFEEWIFTSSMNSPAADARRVRTINLAFLFRSFH